MHQETQDHSDAKLQAEILARNPRVSASIVAKNEELERQLRTLGVDTRPHYRLSPPLGGSTSASLDQRPS